MKHKTYELEGALLDAAVALALGWKLRGTGLPITDPAEWAEPAGGMRGTRCPPSYSTDWSVGGPLIEREHIAALHAGEIVFDTPEVAWQGSIEGTVRPRFHIYSHGPTPLVACMRAFVTLKLGEEVELPE